MDRNQAATLRQRIDEAIAASAMLSHPFYEAWNRGELDRQTLGQYARQYYAQVRAFPAYVSAVHSQFPQDLEARKLLLENLIEEEAGDDNHPELWLRFAEGLGEDRAAVEEAELLPETRDSVERLIALTRQGPIEGLAALYAYESQIPEVAKTKREGLSAFYGLDDARSTAFFSVHEQADIAHSQAEAELLARLCDSPEKEEQAVAAAAEGARALWTFLDGVERAYLPAKA